MKSRFYFYASFVFSYRSFCYYIIVCIDSDPSSDIRWSAAKGIGRVTSRLPQDFGDQVVGSVIELLNPYETHEAWHGACLSIAELGEFINFFITINGKCFNNNFSVEFSAKRGLLLPYRLETLIPLLLQALVYDELKGYMSVGQHIRDAACKSFLFYSLHVN